jgi:hypothetical protein
MRESWHGLGSVISHAGMVVHNKYGAQVVAAFLMQTEGVSLDAALQRVRHARCVLLHLFVLVAWLMLM